jgi:hypothetical protein
LSHSHGNWLVATTQELSFLLKDTYSNLIQSDVRMSRNRNTPQNFVEELSKATRNPYSEESASIKWSGTVTFGVDGLNCDLNILNGRSFTSSIFFLPTVIVKKIK